MACFDQFKEKASQVGGLVKDTTQTVISEQKKSAEVHRRKKAIANLQEQINDLYRLIGISYINHLEANQLDQTFFQKELEQIARLYQEQVSLQDGLMTDFSETAVCPACQKTLANSHLFCPYCGQNQGRKDGQV